MLKILKATSCVVMCLFATTKALAADELKLNNFEVGISSLFQDRQYSVGPLVRYAPYYQLNDDFAAGVGVDIAHQKFDDDTSFNAINILANLNYSLSSLWSLTASAGVEVRDCSGCDTEAVVALSLYRSLPYEVIGIKGQSVFVQALSIATDPTTTGAIVGTQFQF